MLRTIRPYEMSLWTLQDSFLTVLKIPELMTKGHIEQPQIHLKTDGTQEIEFKVPMYYREKGETIENPLWYDIKHGLLLVGLRKIKTIFNKGTEDEEVFEFLITEVTESHEDGKLYCEVKGSGLAFQELGKIGYNISLTSDDYRNEYNNYYDSVISRAEEENLTQEEIQNLLKDAPLNNINYWCDKLFKNTDWDYSIQMDWYAHDGKVLQRLTGNPDGTSAAVDIAIVDKAVVGSDLGKREVISYNDLSDYQKKTVNELREESGLRRYDAIYEEEYVSSWTNGENSLIPTQVVTHKEKARLVDLVEGNIYNYSQTLAETFGVYCRYKYYYDDNYHIIKKEVIFYNNFLEEQNQLNLIYPYTTSSISRKMDSNDVCTKLYVKNITDGSNPNGVVSITTTSANKSLENYILNFDYLYQTGSITREQYNTIPEYERQMFILNTQLQPKSELIGALQIQINTYEAEIAALEKSINLDQDQKDQATALLNAITQQEGIITLNEGNVNRGILIPDDREGAAPNTYKIKLSIQGILDDEENKIKIYRTFSSGRLTDELNASEFNVERDSNNNIVGIKNLVPPDDNRIYYLIFSYRPRLHYENIISTFEEKIIKDSAEKEKKEISLSKAKEILDKTSKEYEKLLTKKSDTIKEFEIMMGPALREGNWTPESYDDYGSKYYEKIALNPESTSTVFPTEGSGLLQLVWDEKSFEGEQLGYWEEGILLQKKYYPCILLNNYLQENLIKDNLTGIKFTYASDMGTGQHRYSFTIGSQLQYGFLKKENKPYPVILITGAEQLIDEEILNLKNSPRFEVQIAREGQLVTESLSINIEDILMNYNEEGFTLVYPRFEIKNLSLKTSTDDLKIQITDVSGVLKSLEKYVDYSVLLRQDADVQETEESYKIVQNNSYFITPFPEVILSNGTISKSFIISYQISNADLNIYLDAREILKNNAFPQVSYDVKVSIFNEDFMYDAYRQLGKIININDYELKFENVRGYISELKLKLDKPWEDEITVQNYKNKFEDLFSKIIASTQQMQANGKIYDKAASAFNSAGIIKGSNLQAAIDSSNLDYSFLNGSLTINEEEGIWGKSDEGVVAYTGGGIFTATSKDTYGNWQWNTGITPSGINASLLKAGQIDTNLIKIYSGNNLRFQLNGEGLFAYRATDGGEHNPNQYVVHNYDGLFLTVLKGETINGITLKEDINRVAISWDGITINNLNNEKVFYADELGNLTIAGTIEAKDGSIGGWLVKENSLYSLPSAENNSNIFSGMANGPLNVDGRTNILDEDNNIYKVFWAGTEEDSNQFYVDSTGVLHSSSVIVDNSLVAKDITLGNVSLNDVIDEVWERSAGIKVTPLNGTVFKINIGEEEPSEKVLTFSVTGSEGLDFTQLGIVSLMYSRKILTEQLIEEDTDYGEIGEGELIDSILPDDPSTGPSESEDLDDNIFQGSYWETVTSSYFNIIDIEETYLTFSLNYGIMQEIGEDSVAFKFVYGYDTEDSVSTEHEDSFDIQVVRDGKEGKSPVVITVESTNGTVFKNGAIFTTLQCKVMQGEEDITDSVTKFYWKKKLSDGTFDEDWNRSEEERTSSEIVITGTDIEERAIFICEVEL